MAMTISDIARLAGVSRATVSGVLNQSPAVGEKTKARVLAIIAEHNYKPNEVARALARKQTGMIGLLVKDISNPLYSQIALGVEQACAQRGYSVIMGNTHKEHEREIANINLLKRRRVDGLIIFPLQKGSDLGHIYDLSTENYPFVLLAEVTGVDADLVRADDEAGAFAATEHFIRLGKQRIAFITGPKSALASDRRLQGYRRALVKHKITSRDDFVFHGGWRLEHGYQAGQAMLESLDDKPDGVFCYNDSVAIGFIRAMNEAGIQVPRDLGVIGVDDSRVSAYLETALTTVAQPAQEIGFKAMDLLWRRIQNRNQSFPTRQIFLPTQLIVRETCGANPKGTVKISVP